MGVPSPSKHPTSPLVSATSVCLTLVTLVTDWRGVPLTVVTRSHVPFQPAARSLPYQLDKVSGDNKFYSWQSCDSHNVGHVIIMCNLVTDQFSMHIKTPKHFNLEVDVQISNSSLSACMHSPQSYAHTHTADTVNSNVSLRYTNGVDFVTLEKPVGFTDCSVHTRWETNWLEYKLCPSLILKWDRNSYSPVMVGLYSVELMLSDSRVMVIWWPCDGHVIAM